MNLSQFVHPAIDRDLGCFQFGLLFSDPYISEIITKSSVEYILKGKSAGLQGMYMFNFIDSVYFHSNGTSLRFQWQCMKVPVVQVINILFFIDI